MSVLINMEMPKNCCACPLRLAWCIERIYMVKRPERCPLVPVPPHGRLIDAATLMREMHNVILEDGEDRRTFYSVIERQPTIVPASKEEMK